MGSKPKTKSNLKSCLKTSGSLSKKFSVTFNEKIFFKEFDKDESLDSRSPQKRKQVPSQSSKELKRTKFDVSQAEDPDLQLAENASEVEVLSPDKESKGNPGLETLTCEVSTLEISSVDNVENVQEKTNIDTLKSLVRKENVIIDKNENQATVETLSVKFSATPRKFTLTESNFLQKNSCLIGGKSSGEGYKEVNKALPANWRVKTFNENKKFFLTPEKIVLKSSTAVLEYLRLSFDLSHDHIKSLGKDLEISNRVFNRYLDELYDECVVVN